MSDRFNLLSQQLLQKGISDCSVEELQQLSQQYPFFAPAQFMLFKKLKEENNPEYLQQYQKAALYHHNPLAFGFFINDQEYNTTFPSEQIPSLVEISEADAPAFNNQPEEIEIDPTIGNKGIEQPIEEQKIDTPVAEPDELEIPVIETSGFDIMEVKEEKEKAPLSFEPFHTVDYFASLGIKLSQEEVAKDNFGRQLKSFTEWLKTMKRLPAAEQLKKLDPHAEEKVENIAAHSLDNSEILTEAMAEVWVKQGKLEKAIEVYHKLSLINPSKRAYFAAKLEILKKAI
jgi:tetratricopeptide (TPR) repeat protein